MIDWDEQALRVIREGPGRRPIVWTATELLRCLHIEQSPRNRRSARKALAHLWERGVLLRRLEAHLCKATPSSPVIMDVAYSLPDAVLETRTTEGPVYYREWASEFLTQPTLVRPGNDDAANARAEPAE
jgi:hypothetical protein